MCLAVHNGSSVLLAVAADSTSASCAVLCRTDGGMELTARSDLNLGATPMLPMCLQQQTMHKVSAAQG